MRDVFVIGTATTRFQRWPDLSHIDLTRQAYEAALSDAGLSHGNDIEVAHFGNCAMHFFGQSNIRGQVTFLPLIRDGRFDSHTPIVNVEAGCATGAVAFHGSVQAIASGQAELGLALGVEKTFMPATPQKMFELFEGGLDQLNSAQWKALYTELAPLCGTTFAPRPDRITILDATALTASWHMKQYGTSARQLAMVASKNHGHGAKNPNAQYREEMTVEQVLADKPVIGPLTRAMCSPMSDGAAAVLVCSKDFLARLDTKTRSRAVRVAATALANGARQRPDVPSVTTVAAHRAYARAKISPSEVSFAEVHDATAFSEIAAIEALGFCEAGRGGQYTESGATSLGGARPVNTSGGLESKGHPLAASGLAMLHEVTAQLRGEAGSRQILNASIGLAHNAGGLIGFDEAMCSVTLLTMS